MQRQRHPVQGQSQHGRFEITCAVNPDSRQMARSFLCGGCGGATGLPSSARRALPLTPLKAGAVHGNGFNSDTRRAWARRNDSLFGSPSGKYRPPPFLGHPLLRCFHWILERGPDWKLAPCLCLPKGPPPRVAGAWLAGSAKPHRLSE